MDRIGFDLGVPWRKGLLGWNKIGLEHIDGGDVMAMKDGDPSKGWELEESNVGDRWVLEESEQQLADEWDLEGTPEPVGQWQPVEYDKPRRGGPAWILPTIVTVALLAVLGFSAYTLVPELIAAVRDGAIDITRSPFSEQQATRDPLSPAVVAAEAITATATIDQPTATTGPAEEPTATLEPTPTLMPTLALPQRLFATVLSEYGVNLRSAPSLDAEIKEILDRDSTYVVLGKPNQDWLQLFVSDGPLEPGMPISGYVGYASSEFFAEGMQPMSNQVWDDILAAVGIEPTATPAPPTATPEATPVAIALPTVTPVPNDDDESADDLVEQEQAPTAEGEETVDTAEDEAAQPDAESGVETEASPEANAGADGDTAATEATEEPAVDGEEAVDEEAVDSEAVNTEAGEEEGETEPEADAQQGSATWSDVATTSVDDAVEPVIEGDAEPVTVLIDVVAGLNVRTKPELESDVVTLLPDQSQVPALGRFANDEWILVDLNDGATGWVYTQLVQLEGDMEALPVITLGELPPPTATPVDTPVPEPTPVPPPVEPPAPYSSELPEGVPGAVVFSAAGVNAREEPLAGSNVITILPENAALPVTARTADNQWLQVELPQGGLAWVFRATILPRGNVNAVAIASDGGTATETTTNTVAQPVVEPETTTAETDQVGDTVVDVEDETATEQTEPTTASMRQVVVPVFATPSSDGERIAQYGRGTQLTATGRSSDGVWIQVVTVDGQSGWVAAKTVVLSAGASTLPQVE